jgi:hypothetical protein
MVRQAVRQAHGPEQSRRIHHLTTLSQIEGQITMTEIQNSKQSAFDLIWIFEVLSIKWDLRFGATSEDGSSLR